MCGHVVSILQEYDPDISKFLRETKSIKKPLMFLWSSFTSNNVFFVTFALLMVHQLMCGFKV